MKGGKKRSHSIKTNNFINELQEEVNNNPSKSTTGYIVLHIMILIKLQQDPVQAGEGHPLHSGVSMHTLRKIKNKNLYTSYVLFKIGALCEFGIIDKVVEMKIFSSIPKKFTSTAFRTPL